MAVTSDSAAAAATLLAAVAAVVGIFLIGFHLSSRSYRRDASARSSWGASAAASSAVWEVVVEEEERPPIVILGRAETNMGLDEASIAALPRRAVAEAGHCCAVCIEELAAGVTARALPWCGHVFHVECVDTWLRSQATCPLCRREVDDTVVAAFVDAARVAAFFRWLLRRRQAEGELHYRDIEMATTGSNGSGQVLIN